MLQHRMQSISSTVQSCVAGHDSTIMTYGQTGSGKTHTVLGDMLPGGDGEGIVGRAVQMLFQVSVASECRLTCGCSALQLVCRPSLNCRGHSVITAGAERCRG
jgi:Kinesin motor domain